MESLWPDNLTGKVERAPVHILKEQATLLGQQTGNFLTGEVKRFSRGKEFSFAFRVHSNRHYTELVLYGACSAHEPKVVQATGQHHHPIP